MSKSVTRRCQKSENCLYVYSIYRCFNLLCDHLTSVLHAPQIYSFFTAHTFYIQRYFTQTFCRYKKRFNRFHLQPLYSLPAVIPHCHNTSWLSSTRGQRNWRHWTAWQSPEVTQMVKWEHFNNSIWTAVYNLWGHNVHPINPLRKYRQTETKVQTDKL